MKKRVAATGLWLLTAMVMTVPAWGQCSVIVPGLPPVAEDDQYPWPTEAVFLDVLANDRDPAGRSLQLDSTLAAITGGTATVMLDPRGVLFTPNAGATSGSFNYTVRNASGSANGTVLLSAAAVPSTQGPETDFTFSCRGRNCGFAVSTSAPNDVRLVTWNFGDGTSTPAGFRALTVEHGFIASFSAPSSDGETRTFHPTVVVDYFSGQKHTVTRTVTVREVPLEFRWDLLTGTGDPTQRLGGQRVRARVESTNADDLSAWGNWQFSFDYGDESPVELLATASGGGSPVRIASSEHVFPRPGTYTVTALATLGNAPPERFPMTVAITNEPPTPGFTMTKLADQHVVKVDPNPLPPNVG